MKTIIKFVIAMLIVLVVIVIGVVACTSSVFNEVDKDMKKSEEVTVGKSDGKSDTKSEDKLKDLKFGDTFSVGKLQITVSKPKNQTPGEMDLADSGNIVVFDVVAKNNSKEQLFVDTTDFNLYDANGEQIQEASTDDYGINGEINAGRTLKGKLYYDVKAGQSLELVYTPTFSWTDVEVVLKGKN